MAKRPRSSLPGDVAGASTRSKRLSSSFLPEERVEADDAETPAAAYADVAPLLSSVAKSLGVAAASLRVFDPYYCRGSVRARLAAAGFPRVRNEDEDFYRSDAYARPEAAGGFDVAVTNPPFSGTHIARALAWAARVPQPALLLLPQHVARQRAYFECLDALAERGHPVPCFVGPRTAAYAFDAPPGHVRQPGSFQCVWYCFLKGCTAAALGEWAAAEPAAALALGDPRRLPQLMLAPRLTPAERRWRRKQRTAAGAAGSS